MSQAGGEVVKDVSDKGARLGCGAGVSAKLAFFFEPTVTPAMRIAQEETFDPIAPIFSFTTEEDLRPRYRQVLAGIEK